MSLRREHLVSPESLSRLHPLHRESRELCLGYLPIHPSWLPQAFFGSVSCGIWCASELSSQCLGKAQAVRSEWDRAIRMIA